METIIVQSEQEFEKDQTLLLKASIELETLRNAFRQSSAKNLILSQFLKKFLDEFEGRLDSDEKIDSYEIGKDYCEAAKYMRDHYGRTGDRIELVEELMNELPWPK